MNRFGVVAALVMLCATPLYAATIVEPAIPQGLPDSTSPAPVELQPNTPPRPPQNQLHAIHDKDVRFCLELPTDRAIHRCAERYRPHFMHAKAAVKKTAGPASAASTAPPTPAPAPIANTIVIPPRPEATKGAETTKAPGPPKTSDVIKAIEKAAPKEPTKK